MRAATKLGILLAGGAVGLLLVGEACSDEKKADVSPRRPTQGVASAGMGAKGQTSQARVPVRLPGELAPAPWLGEATLVVALGEKDSAIIVAAGNGWLRWFRSSGEQLGERLGAGAPQVLQTLDVDGDGELEVVFARGMGRDAAAAACVLEVLKIHVAGASAETLSLSATSRQQVAGVATAEFDGRAALWVASFVSKFEVEVARYEKKSEPWVKVADRGRHRVVSDIVSLSNGNLAIARMYGDTADAPGGVYELAAGESPQAIPSTRGARALAVLPGRDQLVMADGWHKNYGRKAQGLVTVAMRESWGWTRTTAVEVSGNYGFTQLRIGDVHREEGAEIVASGNGPAVVVIPTRPELLYVLGDAVASDAVPVNLFGDERDEVVIAGPKPAIWSPW
ncbi:MAG: hypothetical protein GY811_28230 [Myxococcales bacterium]|nr:hypothetical protein [Myxococcales bacterium]